MKNPRGRWHVAAVDAIEKIEDGIDVVVAVLLVVGAVFLLGSVLKGFYQDLSRSRDGFTVVLDVLDRGLVLFISAECTHGKEQAIPSTAPPAQEIR